MENQFENSLKSMLRPIILILAAFVLLAIVLLVAHKMIENAVFKQLTNQPGVAVKIDRRSGNLISGYNLYGVSIKQNKRQDMPEVTFAFPRLEVHWYFRPFRLTEISWDDATMKLEGKSGSEEIKIASSKLLYTDTGKDTGWLQSEEPFKIGPDDWRGSGKIKLRADGQQATGEIRIDNLPGKFVEMMGTAPSNFIVPPTVICSIDFSGPVTGMTVNGSIANPFTREAFRF
ncbi:MAG: hypothetical protein ABIC40_03895 [bacterium]